MESGNPRQVGISKYLTGFTQRELRKSELEKVRLIELITCVSQLYFIRRSIVKETAQSMIRISFSLRIQSKIMYGTGRSPQRGRMDLNKKSGPKPKTAIEFEN